MEARRWAFSWAMLAAMTACGELGAQGGIRWDAPSIEAAERLAAESGRLVLVHFWSPSCKPCMKMERNVFSRPEVAEAVEAAYVPVKINADQFPHTCRRFGITALPTDVVLSPRGQIIRRFQGAVPADRYVAQISQVARQTNGGDFAMLAQSTSPSGEPYSTRAAPPGPVSHSAPDWGAFRRESPARPGLEAHRTPSEPGGRSRYEGPDYGLSHRERPRDASPSGSPFTPPRSAQRPDPPPLADRAPPEPPRGIANERDLPPAASSPPPHVQDAIAAATAPVGAPRPASQPHGGSTQPAGQDMDFDPPLGLEGYCPVELTEKRRWVLGNRQWGAIHRGRTYLFAGPEEQRRFLEEPDQYAPVSSGDDVVLSLEHGRSVPGRREHGVFFRGRVYLFADEATLEQFAESPGRYVEQLLEQARRTRRTGSRPARF